MEDEGWTTVAPKKKTTIQHQVVASVGRSNEIKAENEPLKQKRVDPISIAELVKARLAANQTQEMADAVCAIPKNTFRKIEAGHLVPGDGYLRAISRALRVNLRLID